MPKHSTQLAALEALLDEDRSLPAILRRLDTDEILQLGQAAQDLAQLCENDWFTRLAEESDPMMQIPLGYPRGW